MRVGSNPEKFNKEITNEIYHRVIIPVYIPNFEGYFEDAFTIFRLNIESLLLTIHDKTRITIYNNNCCKKVKDYIDELYGLYDPIDQVFHSKENVGKINAILSGVKGNTEKLITIADSDVFFKHDWQENVEAVFKNFQDAGMVSPVPSSIAYKLFTANNWYSGVFGPSRIRFDDVLEPNEMKMFETSLGGKVKLYAPIHLKKYLTITGNQAKAVMGSGHFVATLRRDVFDLGSNTPAFIKIQGGVENKFIDKPNEDLGFLRLSTMRNYAYHLGNKSEDWMLKDFDDLKLRPPNSASETPFILPPIRFKRWKLFIGKLSRKILLSKIVRTKYFNLIGLNESEKY